MEKTLKPGDQVKVKCQPAPIMVVVSIKIFPADHSAGICKIKS